MKRVLISIILLTLFSFSVMAMEKINLTDLTIEEKVGQLIMVKPIGLNQDYIDELKIGGIFLNRLNSTEKYVEKIEFYKNLSKTNLFIATDMEGYWNPFPEYNSKNFGEINSKNESYNLGKEHGKKLSELGFNLDFSPIVEVRNTVWPGRSFTGNKKEVEDKISGYIKGLQEENILATAKHYPGGSMVKNPHLIKYKTNITKEDLEYFDFAVSKNVDFVMIGHPIVYGAIDSNGKQATISPKVINNLRQNFEGIIITDAVTMMGLRLSYLFNFKKVYPDLILAGNNIILDSHIHSGYKKIKKRRDYLIKQAKNDEVLMKKIDESVIKILEKKGYEVLK
jgi:beta-N-acetylhexosaminidase